MKRPLVFVIVIVTMVVALAACGGDDAPAAQIIEVPGAPIIVEKEVIVEVPVEVVVEKEVIVEIKVPGETVIVEKIVEVMAPVTFGEAPVLAQLVAAGQLPPVEERLPEAPLVMPVFSEIGKYGGTLRRGFLGPTDVNCNSGRVNGTGPVRWNTAGTELIPWVAESIEGSADGAVWTMKLRKGMKWSDGAPFTADDFIFESVDVFGNDDVKPGKTAWWRGPGPTPVVVSKVDDTTVKFTYPGSYWIFPKKMLFACTGRSMPYAPKHHLSQFHAEFNSDADKLAKDAGFESWEQYYLNREDFRDNVDRPSTRPWLFRNTRGDPTIIFERNPYFFVVDPEGNQLPYIDKIRLGLVETPEVLQLKAIQGEIDFQGRHMQLPAFPLLKENEDKGGYTMKLINTYGGADAFVSVNQSFPGEMGDVMREKSFRLGLAAAIDREFIQKTAMIGLGQIRNPFPPLGHPQHPGPEFETMNLVYDVDLANSLLDEVIPNKDSDGFRTLPSGESFKYFIGATPAFGPWPDVAEQSARFFRDVGVNAEAKIGERSLFVNQWRGNELHAAVFQMDRTADLFVWPIHQTCSAVNCWWGPLIGIWFSSGGESGVEPSQEIKDNYALYLKGLTVSPEESAPLAQEIYKWHAENQVESVVISTSPMAMGVVVVNKDLGNVPESWANDVTFNTPWPSFPEQFYFKR
jgi:peptide/nickel transport system substrate-binding protein